jgi:hypothetical protein
LPFILLACYALDLCCQATQDSPAGDYEAS